MESSDNTETKLCNSCQVFYGRQDTDFLCSSCFKRTKPQVAHDFQSRQQAQAPVVSTEVAIVPPTIEETKDESNPN
jgi:protein-arginine kinase activator protein McsA